MLLCSIPTSEGFGLLGFWAFDVVMQGTFQLGKVMDLISQSSSIEGRKVGKHLLYFSLIPFYERYDLGLLSFMFVVADVVND